ncbi:MAG: hypothetical protein ACFE0R_11875 [Salinarimonas sp.]
MIQTAPHVGSDALERSGLQLSAHARYIVDMQRVDEAALVAIAAGALDEHPARQTASGDLVSTIEGVRFLWRRDPTGKALVLMMFDEARLADT